MADKKIIAATLQVDTGSSNPNIREVNKNLNEVKGNLKETGTTAIKTGKDVDSSTGSFAKLKGQIGALPGPLGQAGEGVNKLSGTFKALLLNPVVLVITLIVGALALLYKAFTSTAAGADKMEQVFAGISATVEVVAKRVLQFASAIVKFFSGDFKGAVAEGRAAISGFGDEVASEFQKAADATRLLQEVEDAMRDLGVSRAKLNRDLAETKEIISDENSTLIQKKKAIDEVRIAEGAQSEQELINAQKRLEALQKKAGVDVSDEEADEIAAQQAEIYNIEAKSAADRRSLNKQERAIEKEANAKLREAQQKAAEARKKDLDEAKALELKLLEDNYLAKLDANEKLFELERRKHNENLRILKKGNQDTFAETVRHNAELNALTAKSLIDSVDYTKQLNDTITAGATSQIKPRQDIVINQTQLEKDNANARKKIAEDETAHRRSQTEIVAGILGNLSEVLGKQTIAGKALAIAEATINTYLAASKALTGIPKGNPLGAILAITQAAVIIATGLRNVKAIASVQVPGGGGGGGNIGSAPTITASAPIAPTASTTSLDQDTINRQGNAAAPVRAFVTDYDIANNKERNERLNRAARLGG